MPKRVRVEELLTTAADVQIFENAFKVAKQASTLAPATAAEVFEHLTMSDLQDISKDLEQGSTSRGQTTNQNYMTKIVERTSNYQALLLAQGRIDSALEKLRTSGTQALLNLGRKNGDSFKMEPIRTLLAVSLATRELKAAAAVAVRDDDAPM